MTRITFSRLRLSSVALAFAAFALGCASDDTNTGEPKRNPSGGGASTAGSSSTPGGGTTAGSGGAPTGAGTTSSGGVTAVGASGGTGTAGTGTAGASAPGTGGAGPKQPLCTTKATVASPLIADFETYDGVVAPADYRWIFGGAAPEQLGVHAGTYAFGDGSVEPTLALLAGHGGNFGLQVSVVGASKWGEGWGLYFMDMTYAAGCIDASMYKGISLWVRGSVPTNTFSLGVTMAQSTTTADGGSCTGTAETCKSPTKTDLPVTMTWTRVDVLWADMTGGVAGDAATPLVANGDNITGFSFGANLTFMPESEGSEVYVPVPGDISVAIDDVSFIP